MNAVSLFSHVEFTFPSAFYIYKKYNLFILKTNKQAKPRWEKAMQKYFLMHYFP